MKIYSGRANPSKSTRQNLTIRMQPELKQALKIKAIQENRDLSDLIEDAAQRYLAQAT